jgi:hypothetical protein
MPKERGTSAVDALQEVVARSTAVVGHVPVFVADRCEDAELRVEIFVDIHD